MVGFMSTVPEVSPAVRAALAAGRPVVALESTIISHGLPRPANLAAARSFEEMLTEAGVTPATIAVIDGVPKVGLDGRDLERIALDESVIKVSVPRPRAGDGAAPDGGHHRRRHLDCSRPGPGSGCSPPAASAACTAASPSRPTSRPT